MYLANTPQTGKRGTPSPSRHRMHNGAYGDGRVCRCRPLSGDPIAADNLLWGESTHLGGGRLAARARCKDICISTGLDSSVSRMRRYSYTS